MCGRYALGYSIDNLPQQFNEAVLQQGQDPLPLESLELENTEHSPQNSSEIHYETTASVDGAESTIHLYVSSSEFGASYNIPPTGTGVIIYMERNDAKNQKPSNKDTRNEYSYRIESSKFGLLPVWAKPQDSSPVKKSSGANRGAEYSREVQQHQAKLFNCRRETLAQAKTVWATPRKHTRCVVPISGYFEWLNTKQGKVPHYIYSPSKPLLFLAGLYSHNTNYNDTEMVQSDAAYFSSFSIVTGPAGGKGKNDMSWLHSRKPVFIEPNSKAWNEWLTPNDRWDDEILETCLNTDTNPVYDDLKWHTVAKSVGNPVNKGPEVIEEEKVKQQSISSFFQPRKSQKKSTEDAVKAENESESLKRQTEASEEEGLKRVKRQSL